MQQHGEHSCKPVNTTAPALPRKDFFVEVPLDGGGLRLAARRIGAAGAARPTLVFLPEALGSIGQGKGLPEELAERNGRPALAHERQGQGRPSSDEGRVGKEWWRTGKSWVAPVT